MFIDTKITKHKHFEFQFESKRFHNNPFELNLRWTLHEDHAGFSFTFSIYKLFWLNISLYDCRHWDYQNNKWQE